ncbi:MAG: SufE family protein [Chitinophagaceae bacterium]|nr:MAG: SufE family protein [Chitinophagaceae bacterium]
MSETTTIRETEKEIIEEFGLFDSWEDKYEYLIDLGKRLPPLAEVHKTEANMVKGCQSTVWLTAEYRDGTVAFSADSNTVITKGLISMLVRVLSGHRPDEIIEAPLDFIKEIGMTTHLAPTRSNGLAAMVRQMKNFALAFKVKNEM